MMSKKKDHEYKGIGDLNFFFKQQMLKLGGIEPLLPSKITNKDSQTKFHFEYINC